jgi:hypothetical protein
MLDALIALTETDEFENFGGCICVQSFNASVGDVDLVLAVKTGDASVEQVWQVHCTGVQQFHIQDRWVDTIDEATEHPLLWPFTDPLVTIYFRGPASTPLAIVGALYERHRELTGDWIPFHHYLNRYPGGLSALLQTSAGEFASGPAKIIDAYAEVLAQHGVRSSRLQRGPAKIWNEQPSVAPPSLQVLLLNQSFVIAEDFSATPDEL